MANQPRPIFDLWPSGNPDGWTRSDKEASEVAKDGGFLILRQISHPTLEFFRASNAKPNAPTVLICPGGGYYVVAIEHEGWEIARRLNRVGIHAAVLKYRLPNRDADKPLHKVAWQDAQRSMRLLRAKAGQLGIEPTRVGIMGFSAGGHLAAVTSNDLRDSYRAVDAADRESVRPAFTILVYTAYLDTNGEPKLNPDIPLAKGAPPAFLVGTVDDGIPMESSFAYAAACRKVGVPVEWHLFPKGGHGYGLRSKEEGLKTWPDLMIARIRRQFASG